jgi:CHAD domain-containing protein
VLEIRLPARIAAGGLRNEIDMELTRLKGLARTMAVEYLLGDVVTFADAPRALAVELPLRSGPMQRTERRFYDTFDGRLYAARFLCVSLDGRLVLLDGDAEVASEHLADGRDRLFARDLPPGPLRDALAAVVDVRALLAVAKVRARTRTLALLDDEQKTVVRAIVEEVSVVRPGRRPRPLEPRLTLVSVRGYDRALERVQQALEQRVGLRRAARPLLDEAIVASGATPGGISSKVDIELRAQERADVAASVVLRRLLEVIEANLPGTLGDVDAEFLHDLRVAVRRSRAVQRELRGVFPPSQLAHFRAEFRWLQRATGRARDIDVYVLEFDEFRLQLPEAVRGDLDPLLTVLKQRRAAARRGMVRALRSERARSLLRDWGQFLAGIESGGISGGPDAERPIGELAGARIAKVYRRMVRMGRAIDADSPPDAYHELRKQGKELRYLLELFGGPLYPAHVVKPMTKVLKSFQDVLGRHQDREVQAAMLRSFSDAVAAQPNGAEGLMAMGRLIERLEEQEAAARDEFAERFAEFSSGAQRKLVRDTFR